MNGHLSTWLFCDCKRCGTRVDVAYTGSRIVAISELRRLGWWRDRRDQMWYCPECKP